MKRYLVTVLVLLGLATSSDEGFFPDHIFFRDDPELNAYEDKRLHAQFKLLNSESLYKLSKINQKIRVIRLLWLHSTAHPLCIRISCVDDDVVASISSHDGGSGLRTGNVIENKNTRIEFSKWTELQKLASRIQARRPPVEVKESRGLADSDVIVIEIAQQGSYNILVRSGLSAKEDIILMAGSVIRQASGEYYKLWTRVRVAQEKCRDPNLSETEDLGDP